MTNETTIFFLLAAQMNWDHRRSERASFWVPQQDRKAVHPTDGQGYCRNCEFSASSSSVVAQKPGVKVQQSAQHFPRYHKTPLVGQVGNDLHHRAHISSNKTSCREKAKRSNFVFWISGRIFSREKPFLVSSYGDDLPFKERNTNEPLLIFLILTYIFVPFPLHFRWLGTKGNYFTSIIAKVDLKGTVLWYFRLIYWMCMERALYRDPPLIFLRFLYCVVIEILKLKGSM
jgi:hypothetical protein